MKLNIENLDNIRKANTTNQNILLNYQNFNTFFNELGEPRLSEITPGILNIAIYPFSLYELFKNNTTYGLASIASVAWTYAPVYLKSMVNLKNAYLYRVLDLTTYNQTYINSNNFKKFILQIPFCDDFVLDNSIYLGKIIKIYLSFDFIKGNLRIYLTDTSNNILDYYDNNIAISNELTSDNSAILKLKQIYNLKNALNIASGSLFSVEKSEIDKYKTLGELSDCDLINDYNCYLKIISNNNYNTEIFKTIYKYDLISEYIGSGELQVKFKNFINYDNIENEEIEELKRICESGIIV